MIAEQIMMILVVLQRGGVDESLTKFLYSEELFLSSVATSSLLLWLLSF